MDSNLRSKLIRLAHSKPELRSDLLPLLTGKMACGCDHEHGHEHDHVHDVEFVGYVAEDKQGKKQTVDVKQPAKGKGLTTKADPQRDPYARSLAQGQFKPKTVPSKSKYDDPKHKGKSWDKYAAQITESTYQTLHDALFEVGKDCKELKAKAKNPKAKAQFDIVLKAVESGQDALDALLDME